MVYTKLTWTTTTRISAEALNHLETQYDEVLSSKDVWNNHDSRYYTKPQAITKFFNPSYMAPGAGADADLLDGHHLSDLVGSGLPVGAIVWWYADTEDIPTGWGLCDGLEHYGVTTANYRDKFVIGASTTYTLKNSYGAASVTPTTYAVVIGDTTLDTTQIPAHTHTWSEIHCYVLSGYFYSSYGSSGSAYYYTSNQTAETSGSMGGNGAHNHTSGSSVTWNSESNLPPFRAAYLIQRVV